MTKDTTGEYRLVPVDGEPGRPLPVKNGGVWLKVFFTFGGMAIAGIAAGIANWAVMSTDIEYAAKERTSIRATMADSDASIKDTLESSNAVQFKAIGKNRVDIAVLGAGMKAIQKAAEKESRQRTKDMQIIQSDIKRILEKLP